MYRDCVICGKPFKVKPSKLNVKRCCSKECRHKLRISPEHIRLAGAKKSITQIGFDVNSLKEKLISLSKTNTGSGIQRILQFEGIILSHYAIIAYLKRWGCKPAKRVYVMTEEQREKQSRALKGRKHSVEHNEKVRQACLRRDKSVFQKAVNTRRLNGSYIITEETRKRLSDSHKGKHPTIESIKKQRISTAGYDIEDYKKEIISLYQKGHSSKIIAKEYNTYGHTIIYWLRQWGIPIRQDRLKHCISISANDGHKLLSTTELIIDNYLFKRGIEHLVNRSIAGTRYRYDFYLPKYNIYIEYWGLIELGHYSKKRDTKMEVYSRNNLNLLEIFPDDNPIKKIELKLGIQPQIEDFS